MEKEKKDFTDICVTRTVEEWNYICNGIAVVFESSLHLMLSEPMNKDDSNSAVNLFQFYNYLKKKLE